MGISPTAPPRTVRDSLPSHGSYDFLFLKAPPLENQGCPLYSIGHAVPSLPSHYRTFITTTNDSVPDRWPRYLVFRRYFPLITFPLTSTSRFPRSDIKPVLGSCHLYTGCRPSSTQVSSWTLPNGRIDPLVLTPFNEFRCLIGWFALAHLPRTYMTDDLSLFLKRSLPRHCLLRSFEVVCPLFL